MSLTGGKGTGFCRSCLWPNSGTERCRNCAASGDNNPLRRYPELAKEIGKRKRGDNNPLRKYPELAKEIGRRNHESGKLSGDNHFMRKYPELAKETGKKQRGDNNPMRKHNLWKDPAYVKKVITALNRHPNYPEQRLGSWFPNDLTYTGDGRYPIQLKHRIRLPDFLVTNNAVVELFGEKFHPGGKAEERRTINEYRQGGVRCLIVWCKEMYNNPDRTKARIAEFIKEVRT